MDKQPPQAQAYQPLFQTSQYSYKSKPLPGKPAVLNAGENLSAPPASGVNIGFGAVAS